MSRYCAVSAVTLAGAVARGDAHRQLRGQELRDRADQPGRLGAEEHRAAQVEHERGVAAEQRDELGLELAGVGLERRRAQLF